MTMTMTKIMTVGELRKLIADAGDEEAVHFLGKDGVHLGVADSWTNERDEEGGIFVVLELG